MDAATINRWVKSLGRTYDELVREGVVPDRPLTPLLSGGESEELIQSSAPGVKLWFWAETKRLEKVMITLIQSVEGQEVYAGELPAPFVLRMDQNGVRELLGKPLESKGPVKLPGGLGMRGGWDAYLLQEKTHPSARVGFSYTADMKVKTLAFALLNPGHD
ncbi:DUF6392 family protein [Pseudomonas aeruginosa]|uniref:DUF6392 family protein n=1 Tax=Pseudomonas aeruginosa TaxID=287 RepID=UPI0007107D2B|nr:DUF6392 family protein [Pseudomonas aeruginosa]KRU96876.1 hypothetical protein AN455_14150 [Pseudomonas aeruginosa]KRV02192.1 hypothetical protein AN456_15210 [Pseudomonas aeruginosa]MBG4396352.1 pyocin immunity protein [Pseudomonas aeruginosa]MBO2830763.1 pyocin immunity protein [Pseudomonas aeruginosa]MBU5959259.1 pyocin immunity protein [Pseudomonas aeruginosa]